MRIGIDATALPPEPVGAGNYIIQLIRSLVALDSGDKWVVFAQKHGQELIQNFESSCVQWVITPEISPARRLIWEQSTLPSLARKSRVELLHSLHYTRPIALPCASVVTFHDMTFFLFPQHHTRTKRLFFPLAMRFSAQRANALIAISESTRRDAIKILHIPPENIQTIPLGISSAFRPIQDTQALNACREKYQLPEKFILNVGLVEPRKNLPLLLKAYHKLFELTGPPPLVIVGRFGWGVDEVHLQIKDLGIEKHVIFTGYVPAPELPLIYNLSEIFVYPSLYEGFGFPPLEAMACGTPTITSAVSAMQDQVGEGGMLVAPNDINALTQAMDLLLRDKQLQQTLAQKGRIQAGNFSWERTAEMTRQVYQKVLGK